MADVRILPGVEKATFRWPFPSIAISNSTRNLESHASWYVLVVRFGNSHTRIVQPGSARAVGSAIGSNPVAFVIP